MKMSHTLHHHYTLAIWLILINSFIVVQTKDEIENSIKINLTKFNETIKDILFLNESIEGKIQKE